MKRRQMRRTDLGLRGGGNQVAPQTAVSQPVMAPWLYFAALRNWRSSPISLLQSRVSSPFMYQLQKHRE